MREQHLVDGGSLVELSLVLAVIGLIIGAMAIGKDVQRNAEFTKVKNKFVDQGEQAYNQHHQRTGVVMGDDQLAPALLHKSKAQRDNPRPRRSQAMAATGTVVGRPSCLKRLSRATRSCTCAT